MRRLAAVAALLGVASSKNVKTFLTAPWPATSLAGEAAEFFAGLQDPRLFWTFAEAVGSLDGFDERFVSEADVAAAVKQAASGLLSPGLRAALDLSMATRYYSPRLEMYRQMADNTTAHYRTPHAELPSGAVVVEDANKLREAVGKMDCADPPATFEFDHVHPASPQNGCPVVLYTSLTHPAFLPMHNVLVAAAEAGKLRYILRFLPPPKDGKRVGLQGYGVSLMIKNMEYKAMDDAKKEGDVEKEREAGGEEEEADGPQYTQGIDFGRLKSRRPELQEGLTEFEEALREAGGAAGGGDVDLKVWQMKDLGAQASFRILKAADRLGSLADVSQNFPRYASQLSGLSSPGVKRVQKALAKQQRVHGLEEGASALYINGRQQKLDELSPFTLLELVTSEVELTEGLAKLLTMGTGGTPDPAAVSERTAELLAVPMTAAEQQQQQARRGKKQQPPQQRFRVPPDAVDWVNDIEKDAMYEGWDPDMKSQLQPNYFGMPAQTRRNLYNAIYVVDIGDREGLSAAATALQVLQQMAPFRIGFAFASPDLAPAAPSGQRACAHDQLPVYSQEVNADGPAAVDASTDETTASEAVYCSATWLLHNGDDPGLFLSFLATLSKGAGNITVDDTKATFMRVMESAGDADSVDWESLVADSECRSRLRRNTAAIAESGLLQAAALTVFNGLVVPGDTGRATMSGYYSEQNQVRLWIHGKKLTNKAKDTHAALLKLGDAKTRYQPAVNEKASFVKLASSGSLLEHLVWAYPSKYSFAPSELSEIVVADLETEAGRAHAVNALMNLAEGEDSSTARAAVVLRNQGTPGPVTKATAGVLSVLRDVAEERRAVMLAQFIHSMGWEKDLDKALATLKDKHGGSLDSDAVAAGSKSDAAAKMLQAHRSFIANTPDLAGAAGTVVLLNGRRVFLDAADRSGSKSAPHFTRSDHNSLIASEHKERAASVARHVGTIDWSEMVPGIDSSVTTAHFLSDKIMMISSVLASEFKQHGDRTVPLGHISKKTCPQPCRSGFHIPAQASLMKKIGAAIDVVAVVNPLSKEAQRVAPLLQMLQSVFPTTTSVYLNPVASLQEIPLKTFYRYVVSPTLRFDDQGEAMAPGTFFSRLPENQVLTMGIDEPEAWIVTTRYAPYDLDNIKLSDVPSQTLTAEHELMTILVSGSCVDVVAGDPPRGLPLEMRRHGERSGASEPLRDTLVMSNFGYFQLKASPGIWSLNIKPGRATEIYSIVDALLVDVQAQGSTTKPVADIAVDSFSGRFVYLKVTRNPGQEKANLLATDGQDDDDDDGPEDNWLSSLWEKKKEKKPQKKKGEVAPVKLGPDGRPEKPTLNIFSVATGHLYERFLKIMMHTTMLRTNKTQRVKFWILNNFLSPDFKQVIPKMAAEWGFDYEAVTYKWPHWLRRQTEKQRIIWGYKVLFLDVLFPLGVDKIIYVDADQIVQSDLHELYHLDLEGRAVGYTPFCIENANEETKGFRFWDSGYWKDHLRGRPYHISAIYVVDLRRFRRAAAGDNYRAVYDNLSQDPASLSNLDQDLPNYLQHMVPIFSLPEHWLWCETWCNQASKEQAKTIDLCNNPLTKTPKLVNAKRIVPEWTSYDETIAKWEQSLQK